MLASVLVGLFAMLCSIMFALLTYIGLLLIIVFLVVRDNKLHGTVPTELGRLAELSRFSVVVTSLLSICTLYSCHAFLMISIICSLGGLYLEGNEFTGRP